MTLRGLAIGMTETAEPFDDESLDRTTIATRARPSSVFRLERQRQHYLVVVLADGATGQRFGFEHQALVIGRRTGADILLADQDVSGKHCEIVARGSQGDAQVTDLSSTNGTFVDERRIRNSARLPNGAVLRVGGTVLRHEFRAPDELRHALELDRDIEKARNYVQSLLPKLVSVGPIRVDHYFHPCALLGGDGYGYLPLSPMSFAAFLMDVSGHGVGAAMHSVSVMNVMRQMALPDTDFHDPAQVLARLNTMFQMEQHDGLFFSMWYGVFDTSTRQLHYASAGHHPAFLSTPTAPVLQPLSTRNTVIGGAPNLVFKSQTVAVPAASRLHLFSDGVFELVTAQDALWTLADFLPLLAQTSGLEGGRSKKIYDLVMAVVDHQRLDDDFSLLIVSLD